MAYWPTKSSAPGRSRSLPAHDPNDYACYQRNPEIGIINILNPDGTVNAECGNVNYVGKDRYAVREMVIEDMAEMGFYDGVEDRQIPIKHSDRSKTPVEPYLSDQWFVRMGDDGTGNPGLGPTCYRRGGRRPRPLLPLAILQNLSRLARRETRLVYLTPTLVGAPDTDLVEDGREGIQQAID